MMLKKMTKLLWIGRVAIKSTLLATIFSFVRQNLTQHVHHTS
jgi:hypothetical protein